MIQAPWSMEQDTLADWAEASCLFGRDTSVSKSNLQKVLEEAGTSNPEVVVGDIWKEIDLRHRKIGDAHPVKTPPGRFERTQQWTDNPAYSFQLLLALKDQYETAKVTGSRWNFTAKLFERLVTLALKGYLQGEVINVGHPRVREIRSFPKCIDYVSNKTNEARGEKRMFEKSTKDDCVDIVAWRRFADKRSGQVVILAGCAAGKNWRNKVAEIKAGHGYWKLHIYWTIDPFTAFAFPYVCLDTTDWERLSKAGGVLLDRLRITFMSMSVGNSDLWTQLKKWCEGQLPRLPWLQ